MRNARILARMVASTLAAAVLVAGMATSASAIPDTGWKNDTSLKHTITADQIFPHILSNIALDAQNHQRLVLFPSSLALQWLMLDLTIDL